MNVSLQDHDDELLRKADEVNDIVQKLLKGEIDDNDNATDSLLKDINSLKSASVKSTSKPLPDNTGVNKSCINQSAFDSIDLAKPETFKPVDPSQIPKQQPEMSQEVFMKMMEEDVKQRAKNKQEGRKKAEALKSEGNLLFKAEKFEEAKDKYSEALRASPDFLPLYLNRAQCCLKLNDPTKALSDCDWALRLDEKCLKAMVLSSKACVLQKEWLKAIDWLDFTAREAHPTKASLLDDLVDRIKIQKESHEENVLIEADVDQKLTDCDITMLAEAMQQSKQASDSVLVVYSLAKGLLQKLNDVKSSNDATSTLQYFALLLQMAKIPQNNKIQLPAVCRYYGFFQLLSENVYLREVTTRSISKPSKVTADEQEALRLYLKAIERILSQGPDLKLIENLFRCEQFISLLTASLQRDMFTTELAMSIVSTIAIHHMGRFFLLEKCASCLPTILQFVMSRTPSSKDSFTYALHIFSNLTVEPMTRTTIANNYKHLDVLMTTLIGASKTMEESIAQAAIGGMSNCMLSDDLRKLLQNDDRMWIIANDVLLKGKENDSIVTSVIQLTMNGTTGIDPDLLKGWESPASKLIVSLLTLVIASRTTMPKDNSAVLAAIHEPVLKQLASRELCRPDVVFKCSKPYAPDDVAFRYCLIIAARFFRYNALAKVGLLYAILPQLLPKLLNGIVSLLKKKKDETETNIPLLGAFVECLASMEGRFPKHPLLIDVCDLLVDFLCWPVTSGVERAQGNACLFFEHVRTNYKRLFSATAFDTAEFDRRLVAAVFMFATKSEHQAAKKNAGALIGQLVKEDRTLLDTIPGGMGDVGFTVLRELLPKE